VNGRSTVASNPRPRTNAITVDVEEWFHICGFAPLSQERWDSLPSRVVFTTRALLDELDRADVRATFFVLGWVAERYPELVGEIRAAGHDVGSHGHLHARVHEIDRETFVADLRQSIAALHAAGVERIDAFRAPEWSINDRSLWALDCLVREGITLDASMAPVRIVGRVDYPRAPHVRHTSAGPIFEVPPLVVDRFGHAMPIGWGWGLRMTSPRRMLDTIESVNAAGLPAVLTVHPWEIDPEPPRVSLPPRLRFAHYFRLGGFRERLAALLRAADFGALSDVPALQGSR
jgi:polysaccharide deacetylase family protein (PEP-CTERM system associated)